MDFTDVVITIVVAFLIILSVVYLIYDYKKYTLLRSISTIEERDQQMASLSIYSKKYLGFNAFDKQNGNANCFAEYLSKTRWLTKLLSIILYTTIVIAILFISIYAIYFVKNDSKQLSYMEFLTISIFPYLFLFIILLRNLQRKKLSAIAQLLNGMRDLDI